MANSGQEGHRLQGDGGGTHGKLPNTEIASDSSPNPEMRPIDLLQGGNHWNSEVHDGMATKLGGFQGPIEETGMEYDGGDSIGA